MLKNLIRVYKKVFLVTNDVKKRVSYVWKSMDKPAIEMSKSYKYLYICTTYGVG